MAASVGGLFGADMPTTDKPEAAKSPSHQGLDYDNLVYFQVREKLQSDLETWSQKRFWWLVIPSAFVGVVGLSSLAFATIFSIFQGQIQEAQKATAKAQAATDQAEKASNEISSDSRKLRLTIAELNRSAADIATRFNELKGNIGAEGDNARKNADKKIAFLEAKIDKLSGLVEGIAASSGRFQDLVTEYKANIERQKQSTGEKIGEFEANSRYFVTLCRIADDSPGGAWKNNATRDQISAILKDQGYKVSTGCWASRSHYFPSGIVDRDIYIRAGKETVPAISSIVESLKAKLPNLNFISQTDAPASGTPKNPFLTPLDEPRSVEIGIRDESS